MINKALQKIVLLPFLLIFLFGQLIANNGIGDAANILSLTVIIDANNISCHGDDNGIAAAVPDGGLPPYEYEWDNGEDTPIITNLDPDTYTVTITDDSGATATATVEITEPLRIDVDLVGIVDADCDQENGSVDIEISDGIAPYQFVWSNGSTNEDLTNVGEGEYFVRVIDANNCSRYVGPFEVEDDCAADPCDDGPEVEDVNINNADCDDENGAIFLTISSDAQPHQYLWSNNETTKSITGLAPGVYTMTLTDANNCTQVLGPYTVDDKCDDIPCYYKPELIDVNITDADCGQENGAVDITVDGGDPPFSFDWNHNGLTTEDIDNLPPGNFGVVVTDAEGCSVKFGPFTVEEDCDPCVDPVLANADITASDCGQDNGSIDITVTSNSATLSYLWDYNGVDTEDISNLPPGTYSVVVTDEDGCSATFGGLVVPEDCDPCVDPVLANADITASDCDQDNGSIDITVTSSTTVTYLWDYNGVDTEDISNLPPGTYSVVVTDADGCSATFGGFVVIEDCDPVDPCEEPEVASVVVIESTCGNSTGQAFVNLVGGPSGFSFNWNPAVSSDFSATGLSAGTYSVTISDGQDPDCDIIEVFTVGNSDGPQPTVLSTTPASCNQNNGTAVMSDLNLTYVWDNGFMGNNPTNLTAGEHQVTVTDPISGCINVIEVVIDEVTILSASATVNAQPTVGQSDGSVTINVFNGSLDYTYEWPDGLGPDTRDDLAAGVYSVTVTDLGVTGCIVVVNFVLTNDSNVTISLTGIPVLSCIGDNNGTVDFTLTPPDADVTISIIDMDTNTEVNNGELSAGSYCIFATDNVTGAIVAGDCFDIDAPFQLDVDFAPAAQTCDGLGSIEVVDIMGGTAGYTFEWANVPPSNNNTDMNQYDLPAGDYPVTVTDAVGCSIEAIIPVPDEGMLIGIDLLSQTLPACPTSGDGMIEVVGTGGTDPYTYVWNNVPGTGLNPNLDAGTYEVLVTDANGCSATQTFNLDALGSLDLVTPADTVVCTDSISLSAFSSAADTYEWVNSDGVIIATGANVMLPVNMPGDTITVNASNSFGCTDSNSFALSGEALNVDTNTAVSAACAGANAPLDNLINNPNPTYTWDWMPDSLIASGGDTPTPVFISTVTGLNDISVIATNMAGCVDTFYFQVDVGGMNIDIDTTGSYACQDFSVQFSVPSSLSGANWNFDDNNSTAVGNMVNHTFTEPGDYDVVLTFDPAMACVDSIVQSITVDPLPSNDVTAGADQNVCEEELVPLTATGSAAGATLSWYDEAGMLIGNGDNIDVMAPPASMLEGIYVVVTSDNTDFDCLNSDTIFVFNNQVQAQIAPILTICEDEDGFAISEIPQSSGIVTNVVWSSDNDGIIFQVDGDPESVVFSNADDGDLIIMEASNDFCSLIDTSIASVQIFEDDAELDALQDTIVLGEEVNFEVFNPFDYTLDWFSEPFADVVSGEPDFSSIPLEDGQIEYVLTFTDPETGCSTERTVTIVVENNCNRENLFFPNLFTPNGDGMNDILYLRGVFVDEVFFAVYDRWGEKVFESNSLQDGWDGTYKGKQLGNDVYGYYLRVRCEDGEEYYQQGNVTLMR